MKGFFLFLTTVVLSVSLLGCQKEAAGTPAESSAPTTQAAVLPTTEVTQPPATEEPTTVPTQPEHSDLYIPGLSAEDVIRYFNEVCLDAEYVNSGDPTRLQKWEDPIVYTIAGEPTEYDLAKLTEFTLWLNYIRGFPGIWEAESPDQANLRIHFCDEKTMLALMGNSFVGLDGAVTFWYAEDRIYDAILCIRTEISQFTRNSVILEELYNCLGPIQDTDLREDSILYSQFSEPQTLTQVDELILKLLYHPDMCCGMNAAECEAVIRQLYY